MSVAQYDTYIELKTLKNLRKKLPNHYGILAELGRYYFHTDHRKSLNYLSQALEMAAEEDGEIYLIIATLYYNQKKYKQATEYFKKAENIAQFSDSQLHTAAWSFQEIDAFQDAVYYYERFLSLCPDNVDAWVNLGYCYGHLDFSEKALECSLQAVQLSPKHEVALLNTGFHYWIKQNLSQAQKYTETLLRINPSNDYALMNMGHIHLCMQNEVKSLEYYRRSVKLFKDIKQFEFLFEDDYKYMESYEISRESYFKIKDKLIVYWRSQQ